MWYTVKEYMEKCENRKRIAMRKNEFKTGGNRQAEVKTECMEQRNIDKIAAYFRNGEKTKCVKTGVELEHFVIGEAGNSMRYEEMAEFLEAFAKREDRKYFVEGKLLGLWGKEFSLSLEPAAQLEISIEPKETIGEIEAVYKRFREEAEPWFLARGFRLVNVGYHPYKKAEELSLIPKKRYEFMNRYFETSGRFGKNMMRATASTQVSIDFDSEKDFVEKYRLACILSPIFALLSDNSPVFEGKERKQYMVRTMIWMDTDSARCGIFSGTFSEDFGYRKYAEYLYANPPILIMDEEGKAVFTGEKTLREIYAEKEMTQAEIEHALSMFFPDVRLKNYIEIRVADSMELSQVLSYTALVKACFYNRNIREELTAYFGKADEEGVRQAKLSLMEKGYGGAAYGKTVKEITDKLRELIEKYGDEEVKRCCALKNCFDRKDEKRQDRNRV